MAILRGGDIPGISANGAAFLTQLGDDLAHLRAGINQLIVDYNGHTHGGVTAGAGTSAAPTTPTTAISVTATDTVAPPL
jgi:hypothetical protein